MPAKESPKRRKGSSTIEYALFLALVAGGIVLAADTVSYAMRDSLDDASLAIQSGVALRHLPVEDLDQDIDLLASLVAPDKSPHVQVFQFGAVAGTLFCGALVWYGLYCRRSDGRGNKAQEVTDQLNDSPPELSHGEHFDKRQQILRILGTDLAALLDSRLEVRHLMSRKLLTLLPDASVEEVERSMRENNLRHVLVCNEAGELQGLISDRDLRSRPGLLARHLMTKELVSVEPHALVNPAITLLINKRISCLPVVRDGKPLGIITSTDLMMALQCSMQVLQKAARSVINTEIERHATTITAAAQSAKNQVP